MLDWGAWWNKFLIDMLLVFIILGGTGVIALIWLWLSTRRRNE